MKEEFIFSGAPPADSPVAVHLAGSSWCDGGYFIERHDCDLWVAEFVEAGTGTLRVDGRVRHPSAGDLYLVPAFSDHRYESSAESPWIKHWVNFSGPLMPELVRLYRLEGVIHVPGFSRPELFKNVLHQLRVHPREAHSRIGPEFLVALVTAMAADLNAAERKHRPSREALELRDGDAARFGGKGVHRAVTNINTVLAPALALAHGIARLGCFCAGCCYGVPSARFGIAFSHSLSAPNGVPLLPVQLYEAAGELAIFAFLLWFTAQPRRAPYALYAYVFAYAPLRFVLEFWRGDSVRGRWAGLSTSQWLSLAALAAAAFCLRRAAVRTAAAPDAPAGS